MTLCDSSSEVEPTSGFHRPKGCIVGSYGCKGSRIPGQLKTTHSSLIRELALEIPNYYTGTKMLHISLAGGFKSFFMFTSAFREMIQFDEHIVQMGWLKPPPSIFRCFFSRQEIQQYNKQLFEIFQQFAWAVAVTRPQAEDDGSYPLTRYEKERFLPLKIGRAPRRNASFFHTILRCECELLVLGMV